MKDSLIANHYNKTLLKDWYYMQFCKYYDLRKTDEELIVAIYAKKSKFIHGWPLCVGDLLMNVIYQEEISKVLL